MTERVQMPPHRSNQTDGFVISEEAQEFLNKGAIIIRMRGLPYECTPKQVIDFFREGDQSCEVYDGEDGILFVKKPDGKSTGDAFVQFLNESEATKALSKHKELIGPRYIELFRSTPNEVEQVLRKSQETRPRVPVQIPLVSPIPPPQVTLPQRVITSGTRKDCIRLRGLPYEARVEQILDFLGNHSKNIIFQGVHMVYKAHGQPSGEAFIQMDSEASAALAASQCHYNKMHCGKKVRYVEVFQCSGDDMNAILNSGHLSPKTPVMNPTGIDNNIPGMGLPLAPTMLPYYEPSPFHMMPLIQNPFLLNQIALQQQQNALAASLINKSPQKQLYPLAHSPYPQWPPEMDPYKPSTATTTATTTTDSLTKPKMSEAEILPPQQDIYSTYGAQPGVYYLPRVIPNTVFAKPGFPTVQPPIIFPQMTPTLPPMGVLGVKRSWEQAFPLETAAAVQGAKRWQTPQVATFPTPGFFPDVG